MMLYERMGLIAIGLIAFIVTTTCANISCPSQCQCSMYVVKCVGKGLKAIPEGIPHIAMSIDLSWNPQIRIPRDYFLQFKHLIFLDITGCGQRGPVHIPTTVKEAKLGENFFTLNAFREMFSEELASLQRIHLANSKLSKSDTKALLKMLPARLTLIDIKHNQLGKLTKEELLRFKELKTLSMQYCSLESIEANTFDHMRHLSTLRLYGNELVSLPNGIFRLLKLSDLNLRENKLEEFNSTMLGLKQINELRLGKNRIGNLDVRDLKPRVAEFNDNKINKLVLKLFHNNPNIFVLMFNNNQIREISREAFQGIEAVGQLMLNNNSLSSLPEGIFKGMVINIVLLQNNKLSNLKGVFHGMKAYPYTVMLSENNGITSLNGSEFQSLSHKSKIYLNCSNLARMINLSYLRVKVSCVPKAGQIIHTKTKDIFSCEGYQCKRQESVIRYKCIACRPGYRSFCKGIEKHQSICIQCPPGSFYQDEPASTECKICRPGQFVPPERSPGKSASDCQTCPHGTDITTIAGTRACKCLYGYSRRYRFGPCEQCGDNGFNCSNDYQVLGDGYWMTWEGTRPEHKIEGAAQHSMKGTCESVYKAFIRNLDIDDDSYDRATMHFNCQMPLPIKCPLIRSCVGGIQPRCSIGYSGALCAVCEKGYIQQFNQCAQCPERTWAVLQFINCIALFVVLCCILSSKEKCNVGHHVYSVRRTREADNRTVSDILLSSLKIFIGFYQLLIGIVHALSNVDWPDNLKTVIKILQYIQFQVIQLPSLRCINSGWKLNAVNELWVILIASISVPILAVTYYFTKSLYIRYQCIAPSEAKRKMFICGVNCIKGCALFLFLTYILITKKIIDILPISCHSFCTAKQSGACVYSMSFLTSDYSLPCHTIQKNKTTLPLLYSSIIVPVGLPILLLILLKWYALREGTHNVYGNNYVIEDKDNEEIECCTHRYHNISSINCDPLFCGSSVPLMTSALRFTYENYHSRFWYWEVIEMIRKLLMTTGIVLFVGHTQIGLTCTIVVAMTFAILHAICKPFKSTFESGVQFLSLVLIPLNLAFGAVSQSQGKDMPRFINKGQDSGSLGALIVVLDSCLIFVLLGRITVAVWTELKSRIEKSRERTPQ